MAQEERQTYFVSSKKASERDAVVREHDDGECARRGRDDRELRPGTRLAAVVGDGPRRSRA